MKVMISFLKHPPKEKTSKPTPLPIKQSSEGANRQIPLNNTRSDERNGNAQVKTVETNHPPLSTCMSVRITNTFVPII